MPQYNTLTWKDGDCGNSSSAIGFTEPKKAKKPYGSLFKD